LALVLELVLVLLLAACVLVELAAGVLAVLEDELLLLLLPQPANAIVPVTAINAHNVLVMRPPQVDERPASRTRAPALTTLAVLGRLAVSNRARLGPSR
jgi:hypothetical protein